MCIRLECVSSVTDGILSDCVPIGGSHRRSWICIAGFVGVLGFVGLGLVGDGGDPDIVKYLIFLTNLSTAFSDVCTDALMAAYAKLQSDTGSGDLQSLCWMSYAIGGILSNLFAADVYHYFAPYTGPMFFVWCVAQQSPSR